QAVELLVGGLRDDLVEDLHVRILANPPRDVLAHVLAIARQRGREDLHPGEMVHPQPPLRTPPSRSVPPPRPWGLDHADSTPRPEAGFKHEVGGSARPS